MSFFRYKTETSETVKKKVKYFAAFAVAAFLCLLMRVWYLQVLKGDYLRELSENNRVRMVSLPAFRGRILDRNGELLVNVRPSFNLYITPEDIDDLDRTLDTLSREIQFDRKKLMEAIRLAPSFKNVLIQMDVRRQQVAFVEENKMRLPGVHMIVEPVRNYAHKELASHVLGYLGEISRTRLEEIRDFSYRQGDMVGQDGLENIYEPFLRGHKGYKEVEVDVSGRELKTLRKYPSTSGNDLILTLDVRVQKVLDELMAGTEKKPKRGSAVVLKAQTGEIIAISSKPSFDANLFATGLSTGQWGRLVRDESHPLRNRAIYGQYPPGSTYKMVTAYGGLEEGIVTPDSKFFCPGYYKLGRGRYRCWKKGGHGEVNLRKALVQSCDVYFYKLGRRLGVDKLAKYARMFGLGKVTGINLTGEKPGLIPTAQWKLARKKERWMPGETISISIGQGFNLVTPLQQANLIATLANGGKLRQPYLVKRIEDPEGTVLEEFAPQQISKVVLNEKTLELIRNALQGVVNEPRGTGKRARLKNISVSGKTGTAQVVRMKADAKQEKEDAVPFKFRDHAWFVAFAPYEEPEIAVAVLVEHGGHGGAAAAPIAGKIIETYFEYYPLGNS